MVCVCKVSTLFSHKIRALNLLLEPCPSYSDFWHLPLLKSILCHSFKHWLFSDYFAFFLCSDLAHVAHLILGIYVINSLLICPPYIFTSLITQLIESGISLFSFLLIVEATSKIFRGKKPVPKHGRVVAISWTGECSSRQETNYTWFLLFSSGKST